MELGAAANNNIVSPHYLCIEITDINPVQRTLISLSINECGKLRTTSLGITHYRRRTSVYVTFLPWTRTSFVHERDRVVRCCTLLFYHVEVKSVCDFSVRFKSKEVYGKDIAVLRQVRENGLDIMFESYA